MKRILLIALAAVVATVASPQAQAQSTNLIFDDFNINEGRFSTTPTFSGSTAGLLTSSTADRVTVSPVEGVGAQQLVFITNGAATIRVRHLSGSGSAGNNSAFVTSADVDGWIGFYLKTTNVGWDVQIWLEGASNNGGARQEIIADGEWHLYEWDLDNVDGDLTNGWGGIPGILGGAAAVADGSHTIDSIIFRSSLLTPIEQQTNVIFLDFVAKTASGSVSNLWASLPPCNNVAGVQAIGPIATTSSEVIVSGVSASATAVSVYQDSGAGNILIGTKAAGITAGNNSVTVSGLAQAAKVVATQTVGGQEGCIPGVAFAITVGGGANPSIRAALTIRETTSTGPVGDPGISTSTALHFLGVTTASGGAPIGAGIIYPSNGWQTVTFLRGTNEVVGDSANAAGTAVNGSGYNAFDSVSILVYASRTLENGVTIYSAAQAGSLEVTSNDVFTVNWSWDAVAGATGYRVLRSLNFAGYLEVQDVASNSFNDPNTGWTYDPAVVTTPTTAQSGRSVQWNPSLSNTNTLPGQWGILESIAFAINDDTGPFNLYIDNLQNGATVFQTFETAPAGTTDYGFRQPSFSGTTAGNILTTPIVGQVSSDVADEGTKSFRVSFQWKDTSATRWLRLTTSGVNNPQVNLDEPISFRILLQPVGATPPAAPAAPLLSISQEADNLVLNWTGGHRLQTAVNVTGAYTNVPQVLSANIWTNISSGAFLGPWTNNYTDPIRFFRLVD